MPTSKKIIIIADSHLKGPEDPNQQALLDFLGKQTKIPGGLMVLGDLFDFMAGKNRVAIEAYRSVWQELEQWAPFYYMEGNHDFDLSPEIPGLDRAILHQKPSEIFVDGFQFSLMHGDRCHPKDFGTKALRKILQSRSMRFLRDKVLPDAWVYRFALSFAHKSRRSIWPGRNNESHYAHEAAKKRLREQKSDAVVFAHTHLPLLEKVDRFIVANPGSCTLGGSYLTFHGGTFCLHRFPEGDILPPGAISF